MTDNFSDILSLSPSESVAYARWLKQADITGTGVVKPAEGAPLPVFEGDDLNATATVKNGFDAAFDFSSFNGFDKPKTLASAQFYQKQPSLLNGYEVTNNFIKKFKSIAHEQEAGSSRVSQESYLKRTFQQSAFGSARRNARTEAAEDQVTIIESDDDAPVQVPVRSVLEQALELAPARNMMGISESDRASFGSFYTLSLQSVFIDGVRSKLRSENPVLKVHSRIAIVDGLVEVIGFQHTNVKCARCYDDGESGTLVMIQFEYESGSVSEIVLFTNRNQSFLAFKFKAVSFIKFNLMKYVLKNLICSENDYKSYKATLGGFRDLPTTRTRSTTTDTSVRNTRARKAADPVYKVIEATTYEKFVFREKNRKETEKMFVFPFSGRNPITMHVEDASRLSPGEFLNDVVIEFYIKYLCQNIIPKERMDQTHIFNSFFYEQLTRKDKGSGETTANAGYRRVRSWTSKVDIFSKKYIIIPINEHLHWYLAIICNPGALMEKDTSVSSSAQVCVEAREHQKEQNQKSESGTTDSVELDAAETDDLGSSGSFEDLLGTVRKTVSNAVHSSTLASSSMITPLISDNVDAQALCNTDREYASIRVSKHSSPAKERRDSMDIEILSSTPSSKLGSRELENEAKEKQLQEERDYMKAVRKEEKYRAILQRCQIMVLDSLGNSHGTAIKNIKEYLFKEAQNKKSVALHGRAEGHHPKVPRQPNHCDCGVFLLHYFELFMKDPDKSMRLMFVSLSSRMFKSQSEDVKMSEWFDLSEILDKRRKLFALVQDIEIEYHSHKMETGDA